MNSKGSLRVIEPDRISLDQIQLEYLLSLMKSLNNLPIIDNPDDLGLFVGKIPLYLESETTPVGYFGQAEYGYWTVQFGTPPDDYYTVEVRK